MDSNPEVHLNTSVKRMQRMHSFIVEESLNSVKVFWRKQERLIEILFKTAREIGKVNNNVLKIILFGSIADKRGVPGSDVDILILLKNDKRPFVERIPEWLKEFEIGFPVDVFPYTIDEINSQKNALRKGVALFERDQSNP